MKYPLEEVFAVINGEREYQEQRWRGHTHTAGDYLTYMRRYYRVAEELDSTLDGSVRGNVLKIMEPIRKFAALGVACMEECGAILRDFDESNPRHLAINDFTPHAISRSDVYLVIEQERAYQDKNWGNDYDPSTSEELTMLRHYLNEADTAWTCNYGDAVALNQLRKVVAIAVRCLQNHGAPPRSSGQPSVEYLKNPRFSADGCL